jgi:cobalt-zinc-cadmium efflux system outer membrane protein
MIINKLVRLGPVFSAMLALPAFARPEDTFAPVAQDAQERTGRIVIWEREESARQQTLAQVRRLLKRPLTANIAAQIALLNNRGLQSSLEQIGLAESDLIEAKTIPNPDLNLSARFPDKPPSGTDIEWSIAQDFLSILMIPLRSKIASNQLTAVQLRVSDEVTRLVEEAKKTMYELQAAQEILSHLKIEQESQAASLELIQSLHEAGNITDLQLLQQQGEYGQARLEIAQAEAEIRELREKLNRLMGLWGEDTNWKLSPGLPDVPQEDLSVRGLETLAVTQRYDLAAAKPSWKARFARPDSRRPFAGLVPSISGSIASATPIRRQSLDQPCGFSFLSSIRGKRGLSVAKRHCTGLMTNSNRKRLRFVPRFVSCGTS